MKIVLSEKDIAAAVRMWMEEHSHECPKAINLKGNSDGNGGTKFTIECLYEDEE